MNAVSSFRVLSLVLLVVALCRELPGAVAPITIDSEGFYCQNGKRLFPFGLYEVRIEDMAEVKSNGFDVVHLYKWESESDDDECEGYVDACVRNGLKAFIGFPRDSVIAGDIERIEKRVRKLSQNCGLFCWYLFDEPALKKQFVSPEQLTRFANAVRKLDPNHPVVVTTWDEGMCHYRRSWDVHWSQAYGTEPAYVAYLVDEHRKFIKAPSPISLLLNGFDVNQNKAMDKGTIKLLDQTKFSHDYAFLKACAFLGIVKRCNGVWWWWFGRGRDGYVSVGNNASGWKDLSRVVKDLSAFRSLVVADGGVVTGVSMPSNMKFEKYNTPRIEWWAKTIDGKTTVIAVNTAESSLDATVDIPDIGKTECRFGRYEVKVFEK